jgi:hypothetical protein
MKKLLALLLATSPLATAFGGSVITANLPANTAIVNINAQTDGAANYNGDLSLWYQPFSNNGSLPQLSLPAGTYAFRVISPGDASALYPALTSGQTSQMFTAWTYNSPWIEDYLVFSSAALSNGSVPQLFDGAPGPSFGNANAAYADALASGYADKIRTGPLGRNSTTLTDRYTFATATNLVFVIPDNGLGDNNGGVSILITPTNAPSGGGSPGGSPTTSANGLNFKVYYSTQSGTASLNYVGVVNGDGSGNAHVLDTACWPRVARDGTKMLYHPVTRSTGNFAQNDLAIYNFTNSNSTTIFGNYDYVVYYDWLADGTNVVFDFGCGMYRWNAANTTVDTIFNIDCYDDGPSVNPVNGSLAFHNQYQGLMLADANGANRAHRFNTQAGDYWSNWSSEGQWLCFVNASGYWKIKADGSGRTNLWRNLSGATHVKYNGVDNGGAACFSPDGQWVIAAFNLNGTNGIYALAADGSGTVKTILTTGNAVDQTYNFIGGVFALPASPTTINATNKYAYAANFGWLDWRGDTNNGAVIGQYFCSGYIYSANFGWINLGNGAPMNNAFYSNISSNDFGVNNDGAGNLRGYAYGANLGWINFENNGAPKVDMNTGNMSGYAWSANWGWISLSNSFARVQADTIQKGALAPNGIPIAWLLNNFGTTNVLATADPDHDGMNILQEYLAGTDPNDANSKLQITAQSFDPGGLNGSLTWNSVASRSYYVQKTLDLTSGVWLDSGLGLIPPTGISTTRSFTDTNAPVRFFRVQAVQPLVQ